MVAENKELFLLAKIILFFDLASLGFSIYFLMKIPNRITVVLTTLNIIPVFYSIARAYKSKEVKMGVRRLGKDMPLLQKQLEKYDSLRKKKNKNP